MRMMIALAAAAALIAGGAASPIALAKSAATGKYDAHQCFYTRNVSSFAAPDEKTLYVRVGVRDVYRFDMFGTCPDIDWNQRVALVSRASSWICDGMDAEVVTHSAIGPQRCPVRSMHKLTPEEIAALPKNARP
ncbi:MAG: hypothetical protein JWP86_2708 [Phenylobacterium sp.]|nr:hypothetical protein [Phenylobacterium sp.]MDB5495371.1 hypothetical protein [Phenylobacterium sp.]